MADWLGKFQIWLRGKKTYLIALIAILGAILAYASDNMSLKEMIEAILAALGISGLRAGISKGAP